MSFHMTTSKPTLPPAFQAITALAQAAPVQNTWYTALDTTDNVLVFGINIGVTVADETLEARATIDGEVYTSAGVACTAAATYTVRLAQDYGGHYLAITAGSSPPINLLLALPARSLKLEIRKTTAAGAGNLCASVMYGKW